MTSVAATTINLWWKSLQLKINKLKTAHSFKNIYHKFLIDQSKYFSLSLAAADFKEANLSLNVAKTEFMLIGSPTAN